MGGRKKAKLGGRKKAKPSVSIEEEKLHNNVEKNIVEDFYDHPSKKAKYVESSIMDHPLPSHTISASSLVVSECEESIGRKSDDQINSEPLPTPPSPIKSTLSPVSELNKEETISADDDKKTFSADDDKQQYKPLINNVIYDHLPQDYTITQQDECAHDVILDSLEEEILVKIEDVYVKQRNLVCLLYKDKWLDDEVINAYICCLKEQAYAQNQNDAKVYFENPFVTRLLKRDGEIGIHGPTSLTNIVNNYLNHDLIHLPINIKDSHWYLASINLEKSEIQVLDSLCWEHNRDDLTITLQGLQYHLDILKRQENWSNHKWKDIDVTKWTITEQLQEPIQKDSSSCGLFMLKFMEYWTGHTLSHLVTQEIITSFRYKLAAILLCWKNNTAPPTTVFEEIDDSEGHPDDVIMSDKPFDQNQSNHNNSLSAENRYQSLMSILSNLSIHELVGGLCNYIISINSVETLEKIWIQSSKPYPISLTLKTLQGMLNNELPMDPDYFNLVVRNIMFDDIQMVKKRRGLIKKHYLDMCFWMTTDFGRHPNFRKKLDVEQLANSVRSWPGIQYSVSSCKSIHIPIQSESGFILFVLEKDTRTVYILDPTPIDPIYQRNPHAKYVHRLLWIAEYLPKAMSKACPGSTWNENIFLWQQKIVHDISGHKRERSGFLVTFFMSTWEDQKVNLPFLKFTKYNAGKPFGSQYQIMDAKEEKRKRDRERYAQWSNEEKQEMLKNQRGAYQKNKKDDKEEMLKKCREAYQQSTKEDKEEILKKRREAYQQKKTKESEERDEKKEEMLKKQREAYQQNKTKWGRIRQEMGGRKKAKLGGRKKAKPSVFYRRGDDQINSEPLPTPPSPIKSTLSPVSELNKEETISADDDKKTFSADDDKQQYKPVINNVIYDHLPQDYTITQQDECAHDVILDSLEEEILVKIEDVYVKQRNLVCLLYKDKWLDDEVISAYICCLKEQAYAQNQNDAKVYFENPFVTRLLKRDGEIGIHGPTSLTNIVNNYLNHDLIHLPINIKDSHWYLASINFEKSEIQVLDSLCWEHNRDDLTITLQGLQYHLDILKRQENWSNHKWKDIDVTKWTITEQLQEPIQKDSSSCGLFMLKFMEYWTGHTLSHLVTQEIITSFRYKLAAILLCWKNNTAPPTTVFEEIDDSEGHPDDVIMSDKPFDQNQSNHNNSLSAENRYQSLMSILSNLSIHELVGGLCNYIISINSVETLD
ncbi:hypothetical protein ACQ4PT_062472 [Festuca glaucescens]